MPVVYNTLFIHYTDNGSVEIISNELSNTLNNFEIAIELITEFISGGSKNPKNYKIDYFFNLSKGVFESELEQSLDTSTSFLYLIPRTTAYNNAVTLVHDVANSKWICSIRDDAKDQLNIISNLTFFICKADNPYLLYGYFSPSINELKLGDVEIKFQTDIEQDLAAISISTMQKFKSYGIKEQ
jgi:hypothetical protein